jgi:hypothetical protein
MIVMGTMPVSTMTGPPSPTTVKGKVVVIIMTITTITTPDTPMATLPPAW